MSSWGDGADAESSGGSERQLKSSSASAITAMRVPTLIAFEPSPCYVTRPISLEDATSRFCPGWVHTVILAITPSSCASTSICALSVSTSSSTSPAEKESPVDGVRSQFTLNVRGKLEASQSSCDAHSVPSLTFQLAIFPSVIVGDKAGIVKF